MKAFIKSILYFILSLVSHDGAVVLMYHSVANNNEFFTTTPENFERQMSYLSNHNFHVVPLADLVAMMEHKQPIPPRTVVITFDDGFEDNFLTALPILKKYSFPSTIFISTANIGKVVTGRNGTELKVATALQIASNSANSLVSLGSHSHEHIKLPSLDAAKIEDQLTTSKTILRDVVGKDVEFVAYPSGKVNQAIADIARKYFRAGVGTQKGRVRGGDDRMVLKRNTVDQDVTLAQFKGIVAFGRI